MKDCARYQEMICCMIDGELNSEERKELMAHIALCPECKTTYEAFSAVSMAVGTDLEEVPEALHENIMAGVRRSAILKKNRRTAARRTRGFIAAAACFAVVIMSAAGISGTLLARKASVTEDNPAAAQVPFDESGKAWQAEQQTPAACSAAPTAESTSAPDAATDAPAQTAALPPAAQTEAPAQDEYLTAAQGGTNGDSNRTQSQTPEQTIAPAPTDTPIQTIPPLQTSKPAKTPKAADEKPASLSSLDDGENEPETQRVEATQNEAEADPIQAAENNKAAAQSNENGIDGKTEGAILSGAEAPGEISTFGIRQRMAAQSPTEEPSANGVISEEESAAGQTVSAEEPEEKNSITHKISKAFKSMFGIAEPSSTAAPEKLADLEADVIVDMTEEKDYEAFAALLLGKLSELPEENADRVYLFKMKNGDMIIELLAYAYGDDIYYTIRDEIVQQNVYLADCKQSELEEFIAPYDQQTPESETQPDGTAELIQPGAMPADIQNAG